LLVIELFTTKNMILTSRIEVMVTKVPTQNDKNPFLTMDNEHPIETMYPSQVNNPTNHIINAPMARLLLLRKRVRRTHNVGRRAHTVSQDPSGSREVDKQLVVVEHNQQVVGQSVWNLAVVGIDKVVGKVVGIVVVGIVVVGILAVVGIVVVGIVAVGKAVEKVVVGKEKVEFDKFEVEFDELEVVQPWTVVKKDPLVNVMLRRWTTQ
jgi:hypothetical protein